jgi:hypothetical protein
MERLMELVAASFARHGVVCPPQQNGISTAAIVNPQSAGPTPGSLPEHNFRPALPEEHQNLQGDPAP